MTPIRILHIVGIMDMGGLENLLMNIYRKIDRTKIQFDFLVTREKDGIFDEEIRSLGGKIYNIPSMSSIGYSKYKKILYKFFMENSQYKIVHCHRDALCSIYLKEANRANIPVRIAHSHTISLSKNKELKNILKNIIKRYFINTINKNATHYFACSKEAGIWLFGDEIANNKMKIIKNGIDINKYMYDEKIALKLRKDLNVEDHELLIGHVGSLGHLKNQSYLIDILKELDKDEQNYKLCLVGDGLLREELKSKVKENKLEEKVMFLGIRSDVNELMMAFDVFAFPSIFEGLGIVLVEAQATGVRCLVSNSIPKESNLDLKLIEYLDIDNIEQWADEIKLIKKQKNTLRINRHSNIDKINKQGYDIMTTTEYLSNLYIKENDKYR